MKIHLRNNYFCILIICIITAFLQKEVFCQKRDDIEEIRILTDSIKKGYKNDTIFFLRGSSYHRTGEFPYALKDAKTALAYNPNQIWNYVLVADIMSSANMLDSSIIYYNMALTLDSTIISIQRKKIYTLIKNKKFYLAYSAIQSGMASVERYQNYENYEKTWNDTFIKPLHEIYLYYDNLYKQDTLNIENLWTLIEVTDSEKGLSETKDLLLKYRQYTRGIPSYHFEASQMLGKIYFMEKNIHTAGYLFSESMLFKGGIPYELSFVLSQYKVLVLDSISQEILIHPKVLK